MDIIRNTPVRSENIPDHTKRLRDNLTILLLTLVPMVIIVPVLPPGFSSRIVIVFFLTLLLVAGVYYMRGNRRRFLMSCILALIALETFWVSIWPTASSLFIIGEFFLLIFLLYLAGYLSWTLVFSEGTLPDDLSIISAVVLTGGIILGTCLHISGWISRSITLDPSAIHAGFAMAIPEGVQLLLRGGDSSFITTPLSMVILMVGSVGGFLLLALSAGKIAGHYLKKKI